jgi:YebC/PmpR family DNA-binding regulatory protein
MTRRGNLVSLWLLVVFVGVQFGAGLYEKLAIVPLWADAPPDRVLDQMRTSGMWTAGRAFWPFVSPAVAVPAVGNLVVARRAPETLRRWWLVALLMVGYAAVSYGYSFPLLLPQSSEGTWPAERVASVVDWWTGLNYLRMVIGGGRLAVCVAGAVAVRGSRGSGSGPPVTWTCCAQGEGVGMSGHSKWATTKHKKAVIDARRGKMFAKLIKNIEVAARTGGGDPDGNPTLYDAIQKAKKSSVPNDNIDRAVKRGSGADAGGADYQTITYEGYGPNGVAVLIECLTDNRNRAATEVRMAMTRNGGTMADPGSVAYLFTRKGVVIVPKDGLTEDDLLLAVLDAGAEEVNDLGDGFEVVSEATDLIPVRTALQQAGIDYDSADPTFLPSMSVALDAEAAKKVFRLIDALEDSDEVQNVYANFDVSDEVLEEVNA